MLSNKMYEFELDVRYSPIIRTTAVSDMEGAMAIPQLTNRNCEHVLNSRNKSARLPWREPRQHVCSSLKVTLPHVQVLQTVHFLFKYLLRNFGSRLKSADPDSIHVVKETQATHSQSGVPSLKTSKALKRSRPCQQDLCQCTFYIKYRKFPLGVQFYAHAHATKTKQNIR
jgi:hypothetical protein